MIKLAAGILPYCPSTKRFLISKRGPNINEPNKWVCFGGKADDGETVEQTATREFREESGYEGKVKLINKPYENHNKQDGFTFVTFVGIVPDEFTPTTINKKTVDGDVEISDAKWVTAKKLHGLIGNDVLHPGFNKFLKLFFNIKENRVKTKQQLIENKIRKIVQEVINEAQPDEMSMSYYNGQIARLKMPKTRYDHWSIKVLDGQGNATNNINLTPEFLTLLLKATKKYKAVYDKLKQEV